MKHTFSTAELEGYLDEALDPAAMSEIEAALQSDPALGRQLTAVNSRRGAGLHSVGEIWRRARLTCPTREQLGSFLLGAVSDEFAWFVRYHTETYGCRYCSANLKDLEARQDAASMEAQSRRKKYFQSSAGYLK